jgi:SAM-dependent methyltransferase
MDVKTVYNMIANDFSRTRYKVWGGVKQFLDTIPMDSVVADIGCGNGKNMMYRNDLSYIGMDISDEMVGICNKRGLNAITGSILDIPIDKVDYSMSIAVIHHLETREERVKALSELLRITKHNILVTAWCFEQTKRKFASQDEMISFTNRDGSVYQRFYHLYVDGELAQEIKDAGGEIISENIENENYYIVFN